MSDSVFLELSKYGLGVLALIFGIRWLAARYESLMQRNQEMINAMMMRCDAERTSLTARIQLIEDRQFSSHNDILNAAVNALETNARAFEKFSNIETDKFPAIEPRTKQ